MRIAAIADIHCRADSGGTIRPLLEAAEEAADVLLLVGTNMTETNPITGLKVKEAVKKRGATLLTIDALEPVIEAVLSQFEAKVASYRAGNENLFGLFVGQVMQRTGGSADPKVVQQLLREKLLP